ncbi:MAG TPA: hypothetical protein VKB38_16865 [Terracidiphilus sp.]|nr:hypothetical protein [Terracidiphilus sp.]
MNSNPNSFDLFERYLQAVRKHLPAERQDDIVAELRANLEAQREEREAALGRPLTEGEVIDWLKELGPPFQMAARYQPPRYLIGPAIFPVYWRVLRVVLVLSTVVYVIANVALALAQNHDASWVAKVVFGWPSFLVVPAAWVTITFIVLEFFAERYPEKCGEFFAWSSCWSPTSLPPLEKEYPAGKKPRSLTSVAAEFVVEFAVLLWLLLIPRHPFLLLGPGAVILENAPFHFAPVVYVFYYGVVAFSAIQFIWHGYEILTNRWRTRGPVVKLVTKALGLVPSLILFTAPGHVYLVPNPDGSGHLPEGLNLAGANHGIYAGVSVLVCIVVIQFLWELWKTMSAGGHQSSAVQP